MLLVVTNLSDISIPYCSLLSEELKTTARSITAVNA
jgi:hypothetical protein